MDVQGTEMIEKLRRSFRKSQETAPFFTGRHTCAKLRVVLRDCAGHPDVPGYILEYFYKLHTRVVLYLSYAVVVRGFFDHSDAGLLCTDRCEAQTCRMWCKAIRKPTCQLRLMDEK